MSYEAMYVIFGVIFLFGVAGYWWVTRLFTDPARTYEPSNAR